MRGRKTDWAGVTQGNLTVLYEDGKDSMGNRLWVCKCKCGNTVHKPNNALYQGAKTCSVSCGVTTSNKERAKHNHAKDGVRTKVYTAWISMKERCNNPNQAHYHRYGGRGITVCRRWDKFENFLADMGEPPTPKHTLDRINNEKGYSPSNCNWVTRKEQSNNRGVTLRTEIDGEVLTLVQIAEKYKVNYMTIFQRYARGLRGKEVITKQQIGRKSNESNNN